MNEHASNDQLARWTDADLATELGIAMRIAARSRFDRAAALRDVRRERAAAKRAAKRGDIAASDRAIGRSRAAAHVARFDLAAAKRWEEIAERIAGEMIARDTEWERRGDLIDREAARQRLQADSSDREARIIFDALGRAIKRLESVPAPQGIHHVGKPQASDWERLRDRYQWAIGRATTTA